jgi:DNA polymerase III alpha subunit
MKERDRFIKLCVLGLKNRGLSNDIRYKERFKKELKEIDSQGEHDYFLNLYDEFKLKKLKFSENQHNNITDFLLGLTDEFDIEKPSSYVQGEFPDIDIDYLKPVRDYIKRIWAPKVFGQDYICEIGTYGTSGIKSATLDMAKILSSDKETLQQITNKMADKDDEGRELEWDKALEIYHDFRIYCESNPRVADSAKMLLDRIRSGSVHAGGLIISSKRLDGFVPLEVRMVNKENPNGVICSAWTEGLNRQDLGPVGLIKFDLLVISNLMQIALCCKLIKERHGIDKICAIPGQWNFSDLSYLNDTKSIEMANRGDLKCIFQFDSEGIRKLVKRGGVSSFDDLAAYSALYRPGPLNKSMDVHYCLRKRGEEEYSIHPLMEKSLGKTYGVLVFQEQIMDILRVVGEIPDMHTEKVRKAISKKKVSDFIKYKDMFIENGQKNLDASVEYVTDLWQQIESFAEYGFNACLAKGTLIPYKNGLKKIENFVPGDVVFSIDKNGKKVKSNVVKLHDNGESEGFEITFDDGYKIVCSANHKFLTEKGQITLKDIFKNNLSVFSEKEPFNVQQYRKNIFEIFNNITNPSKLSSKFFSIGKKIFEFNKSKQINCKRFYDDREFSICINNKEDISIIFDETEDSINFEFNSGHAKILDTKNLILRKIIQIVPFGKIHMYDLEVDNPTHNFVLPNGIVTSNSHAYAYSYISARLLYLKAHYPLEFYASILMCENDTDKFKEYKLDAEKHGVEICPVNINKSEKNFCIKDNKIYFGFSNIKGIGEDVANRIVENQPYDNISDFLEKFGVDAAPLKPLIALGVFEDKHNRITLRKYYEYYKKQLGYRKDRKKRFEQSMKKKNEEIRKILLEEISESDPCFEAMCNFTKEAEDLWKEKFSNINRKIKFNYKKEERIREVTFLKILQDLAKKRKNIIENFEEKEREDRECAISIKQFNPALLSIEPEDEKILTDELILNGKKNYPMAEKLYYGFQWAHILETSPDYNPTATIDNFLEEADRGMISGPIHVQIKDVKKRISAKGVEFWSVSVEDANNKTMTVNVWRDDFLRFEEEFKKDNLVSMVCNPPGSGFNTLTFKSYPRHQRKNIGPKEQDGRLILLRLPDKKESQSEEVMLDGIEYDENLVEIINNEENKNQYEFLKKN